MSTSISVKAYSGKGSKEFQKHLGAVKYCIENELSFPKETSEFFKGKVAGDDLEDINPSSILQYIENGVQVPFGMTISNGAIRIKVSDIPASVDEIVITEE